MERHRELLRSGAWLTRERMRLVALAVLVASADRLRLPDRHLGRAQRPSRAGRSAPTSPTSMPPAPTCSTATPQAPFDLARAARARAGRSSATRRRSTAGTIRRSFCSSPRLLALMPYGVGARGLAGGHVRSLSSGDLRDRRLVTLPGARSATRNLWPARSRRSRQRVDDLPRRNRRRADPLWLLLALAFPAVFDQPRSRP